MAYKRIVCMTGNQNKRDEFMKLINNLNFIIPKDTLEIESQDEVLVAIHKMKDIISDIKIDSNTLYFIEDTSLRIEGEEVGTNIKHLMNNISNYVGKKANWIVTIAVSDGIDIKIYQGSLEGNISNKDLGNSGFAFDKYFIPFENNPNEFTISELMDLKISKDFYSARFNAVEKFLKNKYITKIKISEIKPWNGNYQKE